MVKVRMRVRAEVWVKVWVGHLAVVQQEHEQREETLQRRLGQLPPVWAQQLDLRVGSTTHPRFGQNCAEQA